MLSQYLVLICLYIPQPNLDLAVLDVTAARNLAVIAKNDGKYERAYLESSNKVRSILGYIYSSIRANAARGNDSVKIVHPQLGELSLFGREVIYSHLENNGFEVEVNPISDYEIQIFWPPMLPGSGEVK